MWAFLKQGVAQGVFREDVDEKLLLSTIIGSLVAYEAIEGKAMDDDTACGLAHGRSAVASIAEVAVSLLNRSLLAGDFEGFVEGVQVQLAPATLSTLRPFRGLPSTTPLMALAKSS